MTNITMAPEVDIDWSVVEGTNQDYQDVYPRIQWHHGKKQFAKLGGMVYTGGLFVPTDQFPNFEAEGWLPDSFTTAKNEEIFGHYSMGAHLAIIREKTWWGESQDGKKFSTTHFLCCIKGIDAIFSLQVGGVSKGMPMKQAFTAHRNQIVAVANRSRPADTPAIEPYALWFAVQPGVHEAVSSAKDSDKTSEVTKPMLYTPDPITPDYVRSLYVGKENYLRFGNIWKETSNWQDQFPKNQVVEDNAPEYSGIVRMSDDTMQRIIGLANAKGLSEKELVMSYTNGHTDSFDSLTEKEGRELIDTIASI